MADENKAKFKSGIGKWSGTAEVYNGRGQFVGNALDRRNVEQISESQIRINLNFVGPLMLSGYYIIESHDGYRLYRGPANVGYAEAHGEGMVEAHNYWSHWGLSQRFFLYVTPDINMQMSLALLSRGEQLEYMVVGEYYRLPDEENTGEGEFVPVPDSLLLSGTPHDKQNDPSAGRGDILIHRSGRWSGEMTVLDADGKLENEAIAYSQHIQSDGKTVTRTIEGGGLVQSPYEIVFQTNDWQAWTGAGDIVGSYNLAGGRALSGQIHYLNEERRVWMREVVSADGLKKTILHIAYRGGQRVGIQYGLLNFSGDSRE